MSAPNNGGPAFPYAFEHDEPPQSGFAPGMTLRQWYKGMSLVIIDRGCKEAGNEAACAYEIARYAARIADQMIAEDVSHAAK